MAPTVVGNGVWVRGGQFGGMYGFDAVAGRQRFFVAQQQFDLWTPSYYDGVVYSWVNGDFKAWDPKTGAALWSREYGAQSDRSIGSTIAISDGRAFVVGKYGLRAIDLESRSEAWFVQESFRKLPQLIIRSYTPFPAAW